MAYKIPIRQNSAVMNWCCIFVVSQSSRIQDFEHGLCSGGVGALLYICPYHYTKKGEFKEHYLREIVEDLQAAKSSLNLGSRPCS